MMKLLKQLGIALVVLAALIAPASASDSKAVIKVALLDMSALMNYGVSGYGGGGYGMMGPGTAGQGGYGMPGYGMGQGGYGMMGPGMMGQWGYGGMGPGMMGPGMMTIRIDKPSVKAGTVTFEVINWSRSLIHEVVVVAVDNPSVPLPYDYSQGRVMEEQVKSIGEVTDLEPNAAGSVELTLAPGSYLLICNVAGHYAAGMAAPLSVTP